MPSHNDAPAGNLATAKMLLETYEELKKVTEHLQRIWPGAVPSSECQCSQSLLGITKMTPERTRERTNVRSTQQVESSKSLF